MRDYMVLCALLVLFPLALSNTFAAYMLWGWTAVIAIDSYTFNFIPDLRLNLVFALVTALLLILGRDKEQPRFKLGTTGWLMIAFLVHGSLCALFAFPSAHNADIYALFAKTVIYALLMPLVVTSGYRIQAMVLMMCMGLGFHGLVEGLKFIASGGAHHVQGIAKFGDNNHFAVALNMTLPCLFYLTQVSTRRVVRIGAMVACVITVLAIVGTHSRGGMVGMVAVALWFCALSRRKGVALLFVSVCAVMVVALAPASWSERMDTIKEAEQDSSFMERVEAWQVASSIALENPVFGGGFRATEVQESWERFRGRPGILGVYNGPPSDHFRAAHSIYFLVMGDMGFVGLLIFVCMLGNTLLVRRDIVRTIGKREDLRWIIELGNALSAGMVAYMVGGAAVSLAYFESTYILVMLMEVVRQFARRRVNEEAVA